MIEGALFREKVVQFLLHLDEEFDGERRRTMIDLH